MRLVCILVLLIGCKESRRPPSPAPQPASSKTVPGAPPALPAISDIARARDAVHERAAALKQRSRVPLEERPTTPSPLTDDARAFVEAADRFIELAPDDEETPGLRFLAANLLVRNGHIVDAVERFESTIRLHPEHEVAEYSTNLLLDALNRAENHAELCQWATALKVDATLLEGKAELASTVSRLVQMCTER